MKKILSILSTISFSTIISTNIIACNTLNTNNKNNISNKPIEPKFIPQQPPIESNWKLIDENNFKNEFKEKNDKWYILIKNIKGAGSAIFKEKYNEKNKIVVSNFDNYKMIQFGNKIIQQFINKPKVSLIYRWNGIGEPTPPTINKNTGEITNWNEKI